MEALQKAELPFELYPEAGAICEASLIWNNRPFVEFLRQHWRGNSGPESVESVANGACAQ